MVRAAPGGPFDTDIELDPQVKANIDKHYGLDKPLIVQYGNYLVKLSQGDMGPSFKYADRSVNELIGIGFPVSATIGGLALLLAVFLGVVAGSLAAMRRNKWPDYSVMSAAMVGVSIPNLVLGPLLVLIFAVWLKVLPAGGWFGWSPQHLLLPVIVLALPLVAYVARITRGSMIEVLSSNYIRTARAKGLSPGTIIVRHALKPALLPVVSFLGPAAAGIITGSLVVERIFTIPGLGGYFVDGAINRDYFLVMGVVVFYGVIIVLFNFLVDLLYAWLDPRVRLQ